MRNQVAHIVSESFSTLGEAGETVSVIPIRPTRIRASTGLRWPLDNEQMEMGIRDGVSNQAIAVEISIELREGCVAVFVQDAPPRPLW